MYVFKILFLTAVLLFNRCTSQVPEFTSASGYRIVIDSQSERWGHVLADSLKAHTGQQGLVELVSSSRNQQQGVEIYVRLNSQQTDQYCIDFDGNRLQLSAQNPRTLLFLVHEAVKVIRAHDKRFNADVEEPALLRFSSGCGNFDFSYREVYNPSNLKAGYAERNGNHSVDLDWGIWGHNLSKALSAQSHPHYFAVHQGKPTAEQLRFSSRELYRATHHYITDNFGDGSTGSMHFVIAPMDSPIVSMDRESVALGNTPTNGTPALSDFIGRLALDFPRHKFYTIAYSTTLSPPLRRLPPNVGVVISSMGLSQKPQPNFQEAAYRDFSTLVSQWKTKVAEVLVWDYSNNFDDYLTPVANLNAMKRHLQYFKSLGVSGVFINGSGYDYSVFEDVRTYVLSALLKNVHLDVNELTRSYLEVNYPQTHPLLYTYLTEGEALSIRRNAPLHLYGSMENNLKDHTDYQAVQRLYDALDQKLSALSQEEALRVDKIRAALSYTLLQGGYQRYVEALSGNSLAVYPSPLAGKWRFSLQRALRHKDLKNYRESGTPIESYLSYVEYNAKPVVNQLALNDLQVEQQGVSEQNTAVLTDRIQGFGLDYHHGWWIGFPRTIRVNISPVTQDRLLSISFLTMKRHGFSPPGSLALTLSGRRLLPTSQSSKRENAVQYSWRIPKDFSGEALIDFGSGKQKLGIDEILLTHYEKF
ncbi:DUF4838 domain-containing protein [Planobacterium oryzisoli]|uniref:DUF4838 domain-containing protein n=1 Tax=Planobacterium oryzisoli TaxID=2771435 RepID=A0A930YWG2_9FLAO|nr:DUF4838 domain-containing protein [Planobacterium oryzisoli]MBF5027551.1 DUF4838 domain-containing protein [Planobacterium oryzisoli]